MSGLSGLSKNCLPRGLRLTLTLNAIEPPRESRASPRGSETAEIAAKSPREAQVAIREIRHRQYRAHAAAAPGHHRPQRAAEDTPKAL
jgi:hypothetical protein